MSMPATRIAAQKIAPLIARISIVEKSHREGFVSGLIEDSRGSKIASRKERSAILAQAQRKAPSVTGGAFSQAGKLLSTVEATPNLSVSALRKASAEVLRLHSGH